MTKTLEDEILMVVATSTREDARRKIGEILSHEFDKSFGDLLAAATHRIRRTTRPVTLPFLTQAVREELESYGGKWFTTADFVSRLGEKYPLAADDESKTRLMKAAHALSAMYRAGLLEQRILAIPEPGTDDQLSRYHSRYVATWARGYQQVTMWRWSPQHLIETLSGVTPKKVKVIKW